MTIFTFPWQQRQWEFEDELERWQPSEVIQRLHLEVDELSRCLAESLKLGQLSEAQLMCEHLQQIRRQQQILVRAPDVTMDEVHIVGTLPTADSSELDHTSGLGSPATEIVDESEAEAVPTVMTYTVDVMTLKAWQRYLLRGDTEHLLGATGIDVGQHRILTHQLEIAADTQNVSTVIANPEAVFRMLMQLQQHGLGLYALFHSHRFRGIQRPSQIDWDLQQRLDAGGYPTIQGIVSEDGYWTFFAGVYEFAIDVIGSESEVIRHDDYVFQIMDC
ncbi:hypothetical protein KFU94_43450 [Chloroflexi bacterium TSY]|nr:hypothetical protein [Chloroflexi bacterium TSY]